MPNSSLPAPIFAMDPSDMNRLRAQLRALPDAHRLSDVTIEQCLISADALLQLPTVLDRYAPTRILITMDAVPMLRGHQDLKTLVGQLASLAGVPLDVLVVPPGDDGQVHASVRNAQLVESHLTIGTVVVSVGSGSITDTTKHGCFLFDEATGGHTPWIAVQTANTVTAFTSNMAVLLKDGVKRTFHSRYPDVLISDLQVLSAAPVDLTRAGIGDMMAKWVCYGDWYLAHVLGLAPTYSESPLQLMADMDRLVLPYAQAASQGDLTGTEVLTKALLLSGMAMAIVDETTPLSGFEHVQSHVLDMTAHHYRRDFVLHGLQVGVTVLLASAAWDILFADLDAAALPAEIPAPAAGAMKARIDAAFGSVDPSGSMAAECWNDYRQKLDAWAGAQAAYTAFRADWATTVKPKLHALVYTPEQIASALQASGCPLTGDQLTPAVSAENLAFAFEHAPLIRKRFTVADLLQFAGWTGPAFTERVLERVRHAIAVVSDC